MVDYRRLNIHFAIQTGEMRPTLEDQAILLMITAASRTGPSQTIDELI